MSRQTTFAFCITVVEGEFRVRIERTQIGATRAYGQEKYQKNEDPTAAHQESPFMTAFLADANGKQIHLHNPNSILEFDEGIAVPTAKGWNPSGYLFA
jgi:hypothetical protein